MVISTTEIVKEKVGEWDTNYVCVFDSGKGA